MKIAIVGKERVGKTTIVQYLRQQKLAAAKKTKGAAEKGNQFAAQPHGHSLATHNSMPTTSVSSPASSKIRGTGDPLSTEGIDIAQWSVGGSAAGHLDLGGSTQSGASAGGGGAGESENSNLNFSIWDFGGQEVFYPTHQFFVTQLCIYVVVFNCAEPNYWSLEYWARLIKSVSAPAKPSSLFS